MKAAPFEYTRATSLAEACERLSELGTDAKPIAGGQSLVPLLAMRLVRVSWLVDIHAIGELQTIEPQAEAVRLGACVRQRTIERELGAQLPLLARALRFVGHEQTRNRGTIGGSVVHADPTAEIPLALVVLDARAHLASHGGMREVALRDFFTGPMSTAIGATECLAAIEAPRWSGARVGAAFDEVAIRHGDFAIAAAAAQLQCDARGRCTRAALGIGGAGPTPLAFPEIAARLVGSALEDDLIEAAAEAAAAACDPGSDLHASAEYRRSLARVLGARVLRAARAEATAAAT